MESDNETETSPPVTSSPTTPEQSDNATVKKSTFGRGNPLKLIKDRQNSFLRQSSPGGTRNTGPLTITAANMTDTEFGRAIEDARQANDELFIRDYNGKETGEENNKKNFWIRSGQN